MKTIRWVGGLLLCATRLAGATPDGEAFSLTSQEKIWLAAHPEEIRIAVMSEWPPLDFVDAWGKPAGIGVDFLNEVNKLVGGKIRIEAAPFDQSLQKAKNRELDGLMDATPKPDREEYLIFSQPYLTIPHVIVGRKDGRYFESAAAMAGHTVALERGFGNVKWFQENCPEVAIREYDSTSDALDAVARGAADAYAGNRAVALFLIEREMLTNLQLQGRVEKPPTVLCLGIRKDWPIVAAMLDRALESVLQRESRFILSKWFDVASQAAGARLSGEDRAWLGAHPEIRVGINENWPPMDFVDEAGKAQGIGVDFIALLNEQLGGRLQIVPGPFSQIMEDVKAGKLDALVDITPRPDREEFFHFTKPYSSIPHAIIARKGEAFYDSFANLSGRTVAVESGFFVGTFMRSNHPGIIQAEYPTTREALLAVSERKADAYVGNRAVASWLISRELLGNLEIQGAARETASMNAFGVRKDLPQLASILNQALAAVPQEKVQEIYERWGGLGQHRSADLTWMRLTPGEKQWLAAHPAVRVGIMRNRTPMEFIDKQGQPAGIAKDYLDQFGQTLGVEFQYAPVDSWHDGRDKLKRGEVDLLCYLTAAEAGTVDFEFTAPYVSLQSAIFAPEKTPYIGQVSALKNMKVAVPPDVALHDFLRKECPDIQLVEAPNATTMIQLLASKQVEAIVGSLLVTSHRIQQEGHAGIKVAGESRFLYEPSFACRGEWTTFVNILDKALEDLGEDERGAIVRKWTSITYEQRVDYALVMKIGGGGLVLMLLFLYWNRR
ncbi:MAG TPA: hypothetical protein DCM68_02960, partial [Verrucomicrobia bacterium]|nr:hypothetical protein [Verrucomicrobiota bacterium]